MQSPPERVAGIVLAAGSSTRMGFDKLWADLAGSPLIRWPLRAFHTCSAIDELVVVASASSQARLQGLLDAEGIAATVVEGGALRQESVLAGVRAAAHCGWVVVHDGARPFVSPQLIEQGLAAAQRTGAAIAAVPVVDTIKVVAADRVLGTPRRDELWAAQTPQIFRTDLLLEAHAQARGEVTDDAALVEAMNCRVQVFMGAYGNIKVTTAVDLQLANLLAQQLAASTD